MFQVNDIDQLLHQHGNTMPVEKLSLEKAVGRVLAEDLVADRDLPPFDRVTMDGIALNVQASKGQRTFMIEGIQAAGQPPLTLKDPVQGCLECMTGAMLPKGCDAVIPVEDLEVSDGKASLVEGIDVNPGDNIHVRASDYQQGSVLVPKGMELQPPVVAVAASAGYASIDVIATPRVAVVGTGDELVGIDQVPQATQIRQSNAYTLQAALILHGFKQVTGFVLRDDRGQMMRGLKKILTGYDVVILSGGVSMGKFDYVPEVLNTLGVRQVFHKVAQRPGKPLWMGMTSDGKPVFGLPGNPVSTQICFYRYVLPHLYRMSGREGGRLCRRVVLSKSIDNKMALTRFIPVQKSASNDGDVVVPLMVNTSGDYVALAHSQGFVQINAHCKIEASTDKVVYYEW